MAWLPPPGVAISRMTYFCLQVISDKLLQIREYIRASGYSWPQVQQVQQVQQVMATRTMLFLLLLVQYVFASNSSEVPLEQYFKSDLRFPNIPVGLTRDGMYYVNATLGTPGQWQQLGLGLAQPYVWVVSGDADSQCNRLDSGCLSGPLYYPQESRTSSTGGDKYSINFIDGISLNGTRYMDVMRLMNVSSSLNVSGVDSGVSFRNHTLTVQNLSFFNADYSSGYLYGSLGLGGTLNSDTELEGDFINHSFFFLDALKEARLINSSSYSLWLGSQKRNGFADTSDANEAGYLIFGAVDPNLVEGEFRKFDMIPYIHPQTGKVAYGYPVVPMGPIYITSSSGRSLNVTTDGFSAPVLLDPSFALSYLPTKAIIQIAIQIAAVYVESLDLWLVSCDVASSGATVDFSFGDLTIKVPLSDLLASTHDQSTNTTLHFNTGQEACVLQLYPNTFTGYNVLGQAFMKNAYLAVDLEGKGVAMGQAANFKSGERKEIITRQASIVTFTDSLNKTSVATFSTVPSSMTSGYIPYATYESDSAYDSMQLYPSKVGSRITSIPGQIAGTVYPGGVIAGDGRSFYDTSRTTTKLQTSTQFDSFSLSGTLGWNDSLASTSSTSRRNTAQHTSPAWLVSLLGTACVLLGSMVI